MYFMGPSLSTIVYTLEFITTYIIIVYYKYSRKRNFEKEDFFISGFPKGRSCIG
jgi:hypothetical protein